VRTNFNQVGESISIMTFRCSGCGQSFKLVILAQAEIECPHCHTKYVKVRGEWQDKKWVDMMVAAQRKRLGA